MMENVEGMLTTAAGYVVECVKKMISLGYTVNLKKSMQEYAVPQRKTVIIVGGREGKPSTFPNRSSGRQGNL